MEQLDAAKKKLAEYEEDLAAVLREIKECYDTDDAYENPEDIDEAIAAGELLPEWQQMRDRDYATTAVTVQKMLIRALELVEKGDKKSLHQANKAFETLVNTARRWKACRFDDVKAAQGMSATMGDIIAVCDEFRK